MDFVLIFFEFVSLISCCKYVTHHLFLKSALVAPYEIARLSFNFLQ